MTERPSNLPLFYQTLRPLDRERDLNLRIKQSENYSFASKTNAIPLLPNEFPMASAHYPIVFAGDESPVPAIAVGLRHEENLFVDKDGKWKEGAYIPAYVRRYPFILMEDQENKQFIFCLDEQSQNLNEEDGTPLFKGKEPTDFLQNAMRFCGDIQQQGSESNEFVEALQKHKLLVKSDIKTEAKKGKILQLTGLWAVDAQKFDKLPDNIYLEWRRKGWIALIYAHLLSSNRWPRLIEKASEKENLTSEPPLKDES